MKQKLGPAASLAGAALFASSCGAAPGNMQLAETGRENAVATKGISVTSNDRAIAEQFRSLDEYLLHLQQVQAPVDGPWYKEVQPGMYELQTGNLHLDDDNVKRSFTREELERQFGFKK